MKLVLNKVMAIAVVMAAVLASGLALAASTKDISPYPLGERSVFSDRATEERIKPVGSVCVEGEECGSASKAAAAGPRSAEDIYNASCMGCHATGAAGAPKVGDAAAWAPRIGKGMGTLVKHAIEGINAMPPKGMCMDCSDEELKSVVEYMVGKSK